MIELKVECDPVSWLAHGGYGRHSYNRRENEKVFYQHQWKMQFLHNAPLSCAVRTEYVFSFPVPKSYSLAKRVAALAGTILHAKRPDTSNLIKFAEDTLKGIVIEDDSQAVEVYGEKRYSLTPNTLIRIFPMDCPEFRIPLFSTP